MVFLAKSKCKPLQAGTLSLESGEERKTTGSKLSDPGLRLIPCCGSSTYYFKGRSSRKWRLKAGTVDATLCLRVYKAINKSISARVNRSKVALRS